MKLVKLPGKPAGAVPIRALGDWIRDILAASGFEIERNGVRTTVWIDPQTKTMYEAIHYRHADPPRTDWYELRGPAAPTSAGTNYQNVVDEVPDGEAAQK